MQGVRKMNGNIANGYSNNVPVNIVSIRSAERSDATARTPSGGSVATGTTFGGSYRAATGYGAAAAMPENTQDVRSVRAVALQYDRFEDALLPMVLASGVKGDAAVAAAEAILSNPALLAQAEKAYARARISAVN